jgi:hypothetical protein
MFGAVRGLPTEALGLVQHVRRVNDQQGSSCVGNALSKAIDTRLRKLGFVCPEPSSQALYTMGRRYKRPGIMLEDEGSIPRDVMLAARELGVPSEANWPTNIMTIDEDVPWDVLQESSKFLLMQWSKILTVGAARADAVAQALSKGYPVPFGTELDQKFFDYAGGEIVGYGPERRGGHMLCAIGYKTTPRGRRFLVLNSWGETWGEGGYFWCDDSFLTSERAGDFYIVVVSA